MVADKVAASCEMHNGTPSSRYRDLADLYLLQAQVSFDRRQLREAVLTELARRNLERPSEFMVPDRESWERGWRNVGSEDAPALKLVPFTEGLLKIKTFLDPVLSEDGEGHWDPGAGLWTL